MLYRKRENRVYREKFNSDSVYWKDCNQPGQKVLKFIITPKAKKILGITCDELKVFYENKFVSHYYNPDTLKTNPDWHKLSTSFNENFYSQKMKSIPLKTKIEYRDFTVITTAIKISYQKVDSKIFQIPKKPMAKDE